MVEYLMSSRRNSESSSATNVIDYLTGTNREEQVFDLDKRNYTGTERDMQTRIKEDTILGITNFLQYIADTIASEPCKRLDVLKME